MAKHSHVYVETNRKKLPDGRWMVFWECVGSGSCPSPNKVSYE